MTFLTSLLNLMYQVVLVYSISCMLRMLVLSMGVCVLLLKK